MYVTRPYQQKLNSEIKKMLKPNQVLYYLLDDLYRFRIFVDLTERHWHEEANKYDQSDIENDEITHWERYKYRNDLSADFKETFPQRQKQFFLVMLISLFEDSLNQLCHSLYTEKGLRISLREYKSQEKTSSSIECAKNYLRKIASVKIPTDLPSWNELKDATAIRNIIVHNSGYVDENLHGNHLKIIRKNKSLKIHHYVRIHLEIEQQYVVKIIEAMETFVKKFLLNLTK